MSSLFSALQCTVTSGKLLCAFLKDFQHFLNLQDLVCTCHMKCSYIGNVHYKNIFICSILAFIKCKMLDVSYTPPGKSVILMPIAV